MLVELRSERGIDYIRLCNRLATEKWKEADEETLEVMCQAAGRVGQESERWLRAEELDNFPCVDLRTINQLWLYYSDGNFGFSVQKEIYESLGGTREHDEKVWEKFGERVGWRKGGKWLRYSELTFDERRAPQAHLPARVFTKTLLKEGYINPDEEVLFSRAKTCNL